MSQIVNAFFEILRDGDLLNRGGINYSTLSDTQIKSSKRIKFVYVDTSRKNSTERHISLFEILEILAEALKSDEKHKVKIRGKTESLSWRKAEKAMTKLTGLPQNLEMNTQFPKLRRVIRLLRFFEEDMPYEIVQNFSSWFGTKYNLPLSTKNPDLHAYIKATPNDTDLILVEVLTPNGSAKKPVSHYEFMAGEAILKDFSATSSKRIVKRVVRIDLDRFLPGMKKKRLRSL